MEIKKWHYLTADTAQSQSLAKAMQLSPLLCSVLLARGFDSCEKITALLEGAAQPFDPFLLKDMDKAVERVHKAIAEGESIAVYGDFDCDGITSTVILYHYLESVGANVTYYIPERESEGYGLSKAAIDFIHKHEIKLVITVDNGIAAIEEVAYATTMGIDIVITDHHQPREMLPAACAIVNPHRADCPSPFKKLAGVGVTFKFICALDGDDGENILDQYGEIIALGTLADVVELSGENRLIVKRGIENLKHTQHIGLAALMQAAAIDPQSLTAENIAFGIVPRINATGRMGSVDDAVELLLCEDEPRATELAQKLNILNDNRKTIQHSITQEIIQLVEASPSIRHQRALVVAGQGWHHGVVGIVAAKVMEAFGKPCLLISKDEHEARASGRSMETFSLIEAISACSTKLTRYGGHTQAAGLSLAPEDIPCFTQQFFAYCAQHYDLMPGVTITIDKELEPQQVTVENILSLNALEPFGQGNALPIFSLTGLKIEAVQAVSEGRHTRLRLSKGGKCFFAMFFGMPTANIPFKSEDIVDIAGCISVNEYNGENRTTIKIRDMRFSGVSPDEIWQEKQTYDKFVRGEALPPETLHRIAPSRDDVAAVYRYIKQQAGAFSYGCDVVYARFCAGGMPYAKLCIAVEALLEKQLVQLVKRDNMRYVQLTPNPPKVDISTATVFTKINAAKDGVL